MRVKPGDLSQLYGADPAMASVVQDRLLQILAQNKILIVKIYTAIKGRDVWFEVPAEQVHDFLITAASLPEIGIITYGEDPETGTYLDVPMIFEPRQRRRRR